MGNRAVITFSTTPKAPCIYLHWNGGRASVEGFLAGCRSLGYFNAGSQAKNMDQLEEMLRPFFSGDNYRLSIYRETYGKSDTDNWDNGVYVIDQTTLEIKDRRFKRYAEEIDAEKTEAIRQSIIALNTAPRCRYVEERVAA